MKGKTIQVTLFVGVFLSVLMALAMVAQALAVQDRYTVKVPNGLAFSEFRDTKTGRLLLPLIPTPQT